MTELADDAQADVGAGTPGTNEPQSFEAWYEREGSRIQRALVAVVGDIDVATDATSDAFADALDNWSRVGRMANPTGWTYKVALNAAKRNERRRAIEKRLFKKLPPDPPAHAEATGLWDAVGRLPIRQRTAIILRYVADLPIGEIAAAMSIAEGTVGATLSQACRSLAASLGDEWTSEKEDAHGHA